jgi:hypothetical protein
MTDALLPSAVSLRTAASILLAWSAVGIPAGNPADAPPPEPSSPTHIASAKASAANIVLIFFLLFFAPVPGFIASPSVLVKLNLCQS